MKKIITVIAIVTLGTLCLGAPAVANETVPEKTAVTQPPAPETEAPASEPKSVETKTEKPKHEFEAYEVDACWKMATSDGVEGTYEWPQTRVYGEDCDAVPACGETVEYQHDTYWIRDKEDKHYLNNLGTLNSPADDAQLEPHDYYSTVVVGAECIITVAPPTITQPTCENPDYKINWVSSGPGWTGEVIEPPYSSAPNKVEVYVDVEDGYAIDGEGYWQFTIEPVSEKECDNTPEPNDDPTTPTAGQLPDTGAPTGLKGLGIAAAMLIAGLGLLKLGRRVV